MRKQKLSTRKKNLTIADKTERIIFLALMLFLCWWGITFLFNPRTARENPQPITGESIRVILLNGCGVSGACATMANFLLKSGFDVIDKINADSKYYPHTLIINRKGNKEKALKLAKFLGIPESSVITHKEIKSSGVEDVILLLGKDYKKVIIQR